MTLMTQGMDAFENNPNITKHETLGAIGTLTSVLDTIKSVKDAKLIDWPLQQSRHSQAVIRWVISPRL